MNTDGRGLVFVVVDRKALQDESEVERKQERVRA